MLNGNELAEVLRSIDDEVLLELGQPAERYPVVIVGGSALMLRGLTKRPATHDIDVLEADARIEGILSRYGMVNSRVSAYADTLPYNFEDRLEELPFHGKAVRFLSPSLEDIAVMKLYAWRPNDRSDLESPRVLERLDWARLDNLVNSPDEARASVLSDRAFDEMRHAYEKYRRQWHDKADV